MKWISALNLQQWADTLQARAVFPGLVGDLIRASATEIGTFRFASGDKSQVRGFDGRLQSTGAPPFVPAGDSIWEFGVNAGAAAKANEDYAKRTKEIPAARRAEMSFVFVSPRTWDNPKQKLDDWLKDKRDLKEWKQVEYIDGVGVETWLDDHPAVAARYARYELNLLPQVGVLSTAEFWDEYSTRFDPPLTEEVLLCDRQPQADKLLRALAEPSGMVSFAADSPDEVIAFAVAALRKAEDAARLFLEARTLIVDTVDAARLMLVKKGLAFLPRGQARNVAGMLGKAGSTLVTVGGDELKRNHDVLARPSSGSLGKAFSTMGLSGDEGYELARKCGRSVTVLARLIPSGSAELPEWIGHGKLLLPALLAGGWSASSALDTSVLCGLANVAMYEDVEVPLRPLTRLKDPPLDRVDNVWRMRAPVDAFVHLGHLIGADDLKRLKIAATTVFGKIVDPPEANELFSLSRKQAEQHSEWLREGLATTLLQIAVLHDQANLVIPGSTPQHFVDVVVRSLPGLSSNYRLLASLQDNLALLAEAAPDPLLQALEQMLEGDGSALRPIFNESENFLAPTSPHTGLLWAMEVLAWDPTHLPRVVQILARLAAIDPGGKLGNRPINSLRTIFLSWAPNTNATLKQRIGALDYIIRTVPGVGWDLLTKLLPRSQDTSSPAVKPKFREAGASEAESLTYGVVWESEREIISRALAQAERQPTRLVTIIKSMSEFQPDSRNKTLDVVEGYLEKNAQSDGTYLLWAALREEVNRHRAFADADWALKEEELARIDLIVDKYEPSDPVRLNVWVFDDWMPSVPGKLDDLVDSVDAARRTAAQTVFAQLGIAGLQSLAEAAKLKQLVAGALDGVNVDALGFAELVKNSVGRSDELEHFASVASAVAAKRFGDQWVAILKEMAITNKWAPSTVARLLSALPDVRGTWTLVAEFGPETETSYWSRNYSHAVSDNAEDLLFIARQYMSVGRPLAALDALHRKSSHIPAQLLLELLDAAVSEINRSKGAGGGMTGYHLEKIFEALEARDDVAAEEIARREYAYLPLLDRRKKPLLLHRLLAKDPGLYVSVIRDVFKPASGEVPEPTEEGRARATVGYRLLSSITVVPGQTGEELDFGILRTWCLEVRKQAAAIDRARIADQYIGHILAHAPAEKSDGAWPHAAVRQMLEDLCSDEVERGLAIERRNMRGVYWKSIGGGGTQERALAKQAQDWAKAMPSYPRAAALLNRIGDSWEHDAKQEDIRSEQDRLKW